MHGLTTETSITILGYTRDTAHVRISSPHDRDFCHYSDCQHASKVYLIQPMHPFHRSTIPLFHHSTIPIPLNPDTPKLDIESAYRLIPVHADDRPLLGMCWREKTYIDSALLHNPSAVCLHSLVLGAPMTRKSSK